MYIKYYTHTKFKNTQYNTQINIIGFLKFETDALKSWLR